MLGDSITAQHLHSNYFEAFCYARFPQLTFRFRNSGVCGDTIPKALKRFEYDVKMWKPTVVSVELGMNDARKYKAEKYMENMKKLIIAIIDINARPILFSPSPVNTGNSPEKLDRFNIILRNYTMGLKAFSNAKRIPFANQFKFLIRLWAKNKPQEELAKILALLRKFETAHPDVKGSRHIKAFITEWNKAEKQPVSMQGDVVHPGPIGQLIMAAILLKELGAPSLVSMVVIDATDKKVNKALKCKINNLKVDNGILSFDRQDEALPFPIPDKARPALTVTDVIENLSLYLLKVSGLPVERYEVEVDGTFVGTVDSNQLSKGWNMGLMDKGPIANQCQSILRLVTQKENYVNELRNHIKKGCGIDKQSFQDKLQKINAKIINADAKIHAVAQPVKHHFEFSRIVRSRYRRCRWDLMNLW